MSTVLYPVPLPPISYMALWVKGQCQWNTVAAYRKRTWRNRYRILGPNGPQDLSFPLVHSTAKGSFVDLRLEHRNDWCDKEWRSIETAYRNASFFEALAPDLEPIIREPHDFLLERNKALMQWTLIQLQIDGPWSESMEEIDERLVSPPSVAAPELPTYRQVFQMRHGFTPNLSILDLLMNEGPLAHDYLVNFPNQS